RVRLQQAEGAELLARRAASDASLGARDRGEEVAPLEALLRCAVIPADGKGRFAAALEVLGEHHRVALGGALEPVRGETVAELAIAIGEHRVGGLADDLVTELVLLL